MSAAVTPYPAVDVNLFVHNGEVTVGAVIESLLAQTWPALNLTLIDDGSTDRTALVLTEYAARDPAIKIRSIRCNGGSVSAFQRAFWSGDADFVMPKSGDDLVAPEFIEKIMDVLLSHPTCAMCHAAGLVCSGDGIVRGVYPTEHRLLAVDPDPAARAMAVMRTYTSSPSFWGIYRRSAADRLAPIVYRAGWDHVLLAELALYGEIRHVPDVLYWRRDGGRPVADLARRATLAVNRGLTLDAPISEQRWRTPLITTAYAHLENFSVARLDPESRAKLMTVVPEIFRLRWLPFFRAEARALRDALPALIMAAKEADPLLNGWAAHQVAQAVHAARTILPDEDFSVPPREIQDVVGSVRLPIGSSAG